MADEQTKTIEAATDEQMKEIKNTCLHFISDPQHDTLSIFYDAMALIARVEQDREKLKKLADFKG